MLIFYTLYVVRHTSVLDCLSFRLSLVLISSFTRCCNKVVEQRWQGGIQITPVSRVAWVCKPKLWRRFNMNVESQHRLPASSPTSHYSTFQAQLYSNQQQRIVFQNEIKYILGYSDPGYILLTTYVHTFPGDSNDISAKKLHCSADTCSASTCVSDSFWRWSRHDRMA